MTRRLQVLQNTKSQFMDKLVYREEKEFGQQV